MFRNTKTYTALLRKVEPALEEVWPNCWIDDECCRVSVDAEDLERLMMASYRLMKHIRSWLKKKKLDYTESNTVPPLYTALERLATIIVYKEDRTLALEASALEAVSRACYSWMKINHVLNTARRIPVVWCQSCKTEPATDTVLCDYCRGLEQLPETG